MADPTERDPVAVRYARAADLGTTLILVVWHFGYDVLILARGWASYDHRSAAVVAWVLLAVVQTAATVLLSRDALGAVAARALAGITLVAGVCAVVSYPPGQALSDISWASNTIGWFGVLLLMRRPLGELVVLMALNTAITVTALAADGVLDRVMVSRLVMVVYATAGIQLLFAMAGHLLVRTGHQVTRMAAEQAELRHRIASDEAVHTGRRYRYADLQERITPLLHGLAERALDPGDPVVQRRAGIEAARLRRLFAETDDTPHPLLHELRACADVAERRDVDVTLLAYGDLPELPTSARRELTEAPMLVLASAASWARLTVLAHPQEVVVGVIADAPPDVMAGIPESMSLSVTYESEGNQLWVETRQQHPEIRSA